MDYRLVKIFHKDLNESQSLELQNVNYENILNVVQRKYSKDTDFVRNPLVLLNEDKEIKDQKDLDAAFANTYAQGKSHLELVAKFSNNSQGGEQTPVMTAEQQERGSHWRSASVSFSSSSTEDSFEVLPHHHVDIRCYVCDAEIYGVRFQCMNCESDFNLCEDCEADIDGRHFPTHVFAKIRHPEATSNLVQIRKLAQGSTTTTATVEIPKVKAEHVDVSTSPIFPLAPTVEFHDMASGCDSLKEVRLVDCGCDAPARIVQSDASQQVDPCQNLSVRSCVTQTSIDATKESRKKLSCTKVNSQSMGVSTVLNAALEKQLDTVSFDWTLSSSPEGAVSYKEVIRQSWHLHCQGPIVWPQQCLQVIPLKQSAGGKCGGDVNTFLEAIQCWAKLRHRSTGQLVCKTMISLSGLSKADLKSAMKSGQSALIHWHICTNNWPPKPLASRMTTKVYLKAHEDSETAGFIVGQKKKKRIVVCFECLKTSTNDEIRRDESGKHSPRASLGESCSTQGDSLAPEVQEALVTPMGSCTGLATHVETTSNNNPFDDLLLDSQPKCGVKTPIETEMAKPSYSIWKTDGLGSMSRSSSEEVLPSFVQPRMLCKPDGTQTMEWVFVSPDKHPKPMNTEASTVAEQRFSFTHSTPVTEKPSNCQSISEEVVAPQCSLQSQATIVEQPGPTSSSPAAAPRECPEAYQRWLQTENDAWIPVTSYRGPPAPQTTTSVPVWLPPTVERACSGQDEAYLGAHYTEPVSQSTVWSSPERATGMPVTSPQHTYQYESLTPMSELMSMGFYNRELNQRLLNQHDNNLESVIEELLRME